VFVCTLQAVQKYGGDYLLGACLQGLEETQERERTELQYQAAWKVAQWDLDIPTL